MKQQKSHLAIIILVILLVWSVVMNLLQNIRIDQLIEERSELESAVSVMSSHIDELKNVGSLHLA